MSSLVDTTWLAGHLDGDDEIGRENVDVVVIEVSSETAGDADYFTEHIPGSHFANWKALCWHDTDREFPTPDVMAQRLGALGVGAEAMIVLVGDPIQYATYAYWVLAMTGFAENTVLLDGGRAAWLAGGHPTTADIIEPQPAAGQPAPASPAAHARVDCRVGRDDVRNGLESPDRVLLDMRSPEEFTGERVSPTFMEVDHGAQRTGRIPGARHLYYMQLLTDEGTFKPIDQMAAEFEEVGAVHEREIVTYCRLSHRATLGWFVMTELLGYPTVKVYDGSWTEWGSIVGFPIER